MAHTFMALLYEVFSDWPIYCQIWSRRWPKYYFP